MQGQRFPILEHEGAYLNHAAVAPLTEPAAQILRRYADHASKFGPEDWQAAFFSDPRGEDWYRDLQAIREFGAAIVGAARASEIAFVPNTSTGLAVAAQGLEWQPGDQVITTTVEFPANRYLWHDLRRLDVEVIEIEPDADHRIHVDDLVAAVTPRTRVLAISHAQYASGFRIELPPLAEAVHAVGGLLVVDAIQTVGAMPVEADECGVDVLAADGHKWMLGPEGAGLLYVRKSVCEQLRPPITGWIGMMDAMTFDRYRFEFRSDARRFEPGTWNIPGTLSMGASLRLLLEEGLDRVWTQIEALTARLHDGLLGLGYRVISPREHEHERSGIVTFVPGGAVNPQSVIDQLKSQHFTIALRAGRLRVSPHFYNTADQIDALLECMPPGR